MKYEISEKLLQDIRQETTRIMEEVIQNRRYLHMHPEVGYDTQETEIWVKSQLQKEQIQILDSKVGVLGLIPGKCHDRMVGLRADMDALCLQEENETDYKSKVPGRMHACGHDGHTAMLLGAAKLLKKHCDKLATDILLIFNRPKRVRLRAARNPCWKKCAGSALQTKLNISSDNICSMIILSALQGVNSVLLHPQPMNSILPS